MPEDRDSAALLRTAREVWTGSFQGVLSTHSAAHPGYPFGSALPLCLDPEGLPVLLLSHLAQHSKNLAANPACGLLLSRENPDDVQQSVRLSLIADARPGAPDASRACYFRHFPHTRDYYEQLNFRFWRLHPGHCHVNAGFAAARWLGTERLVPPTAFDTRVETQMRELAELRQAELRSRLGIAGTPDPTPLEIIALDGSGMTLRLGPKPHRLHFPRPIGKPEELKAYLMAKA